MNHRRLAEIAVINPKFSNSEGLTSDSLVAFVPMAAVSEQEGVIVKVEARRLHQVTNGFTYFRNGDVLMAKITPCFENGKIAHARIRYRAGFASTEFHVLRVNRRLLDSRYLFHFLRQKRILLEGEQKMTGSAGH